jgi:hypothetical protein
LSLIAIVALAQAAALPAAPVVDKIVCHYESQTSSRIPNRVCLPQSRWAEIERQNRDDLLSSRNIRAGGRSGTIVDSPEGGVVSPHPPR